MCSSDLREAHVGPEAARDAVGECRLGFLVRFRGRRAEHDPVRLDELLQRGERDHAGERTP